MDKQPGPAPLAQQLDEEMAKWQKRIDEAQVQLNLGAKEAQDSMQPHLEQLEREFHAAKRRWQEFGEASEGARTEIERGLSSSLETMQQAFDKAAKHFSDSDPK